MTAQVSEKLIYKGETLQLCSVPLSGYLSAVGSEEKFSAPHTALWRGYVGTWTIEDGHLYLVKLVGYVNQGSEVGLSHLFPDYPDGVFAHWFTGELRCPMVEMLRYVHAGFASTCEQDLFIQVDKGVVVSERIVSNGVGTGKSSSGYSVGALTTIGSE